MNKEDFVMKKRNKLVAVLLAGTMAALLKGCGSSADTSTDTTPATEAATESATEAATTETASNSDTPLVIAHDDVSEKFSPFFGE